MPAPSVTYSFTNATTSDATQVNQNFTDLVNGLSDGSKTLTVSGIVAATSTVTTLSATTLAVSGASSFVGTITVGDASTANGLFNSVRSIYMNIDSDNTGTGEIFAWGHNSAVTGSTRLMTLGDDGGLTLPISLAGTGTRVVTSTSAGLVGNATTIAGANTWSDAQTFSSTLAGASSTWSGTVVATGDGSFSGAKARTSTTIINGSATDKGYFIAGTSGGNQVQIDSDEIQAMNNATPAQLFINNAGGAVNICASGVTTTVQGRLTVAELLLTVASASGAAGLRIPHGAAPSSPTNGDMWTTSAGAFIRINGVTKTFTLT